FKKTWSGIGDVFGGISAYIMTPYDWAMDKMFGPVDHSDTDKQKAALRNFGKSLVAWDEWGKDPSRAFGTVLFNAVTIGSGSLLKLGKAGKLGVGAEAVTAVGKAGALVDPMTYLGKAAGVTKIKVGDLMESLKTSRAGVDDMARTMPAGTGTSPHPGEVATPPGLAYVDHAGNTRIVGDDAVIRDEHGNAVPDTQAVPEPHKNDLSSTHETVPEREKVLEGAGGPGRVENSVDQPSSGGGGPHNTPSTVGHASDHATGGGSGDGAGAHPPAGGGGSHTPPGGGGSHSPNGGEGPGDTPDTGANSHPETTPGGERANEPLPELTAEERAGQWGHLEDVEKRAPDEFDHLKHDPDHRGKITDDSMDEARVGLDLREQGRLPADIRRPEAADKGEFYSESTGKYYDIKGVHSFWPPFNNVRNADLLARPFPGAYNPAKHTQVWVKTFTEQIVEQKRIVIVDVRNANQGAIDSIKSIVESHGWGDHVIWYP
ncbi:hypothetical protein ABZ456_27545, partial [Streptomyces sp. NPDC005776]